jgi:hypothetical protein
MKTVIFLFGFFIGFTASADYSVTPPTVVYTGTLSHTKTNKVQKVSLYVFDATKPGASVSSFSAILSLQFGPFGGSEYIGLNYDNIGFNQKRRELFLHRDDDARGRRLPTVKLRYNETGGVMTGEFYSQTEGKIGTLNLNVGWELKKEFNEALEVHSLAGIYAAQCDSNDTSSPLLTGLEIIPSRILADKSAAEGSLNVINYIGSGVCEFDGLKSCVSFDYGNYNFFRDILTFREGAWTWQCRRIDPEKMICDSPRYPNCALTRVKSIAIKHPPRPVGGLASTILELTKRRALASDFDCSTWEGVFRGTLDHVNGNREQAVEIELTTFQTHDEPVRCMATGAARLFFENTQGIPEKLTYALPQFEFDPNFSDQTFMSELFSDLVVSVRSDRHDRLQGYWFSRLYGLVGEVSLKKDAPFPDIDPAERVYGLSGEYIQHNAMNRGLYISAQEAGFDKSSHDPYVQLRLNGYFQISFLDPTVISGPSKVIVSKDPIVSASYDYFTNLVVIRTTGLYSGFTNAGGLEVHGQSSRYLMNALPLGTQYKFERL